ncbi:MAG: hypothetical protein U0Y68_05385 [Blastocatellia bacterium]
MEGGAITQPALLADGNLIINAIATSGALARAACRSGRRRANGTVEERWTSNGLKPYFNDLPHKGCAYGFDGNILASIDLADGKRKMDKADVAGNGQLSMLPEQDLLLVLSEEGELALVSATTDQFKELARFHVLDSKNMESPGAGQ